jgi:hypothetical protein
VVTQSHFCVEGTKLLPKWCLLPLRVLLKKENYRLTKLIFGIMVFGVGVQLPSVLKVGAAPRALVIVLQYFTCEWLRRGQL